MGMLDSAYHASWQIYQLMWAILSAFVITVFGCMFQFDLFLENDFGVVFFTFMFFQISMVGCANILCASVTKAQSSVMIGLYPRPYPTPIITSILSVTLALILP